jgi:hypothetical protein
MPWLEFSAEKARTDVEAGSDPAAVLGALITDVERFAEHNRKKKQVRDVPEEVRKQRSERMKEMRARGIGGWPKKGSKTPRKENDGVSHAQG